MWKSIHQGLAGVEPAVKQFLPPCQMQCPINEDIQRTNILISLLPDDLELARDGIIQIGDYLFEKIPCSLSADMSVVYANWNVITRPRGAPSEEDS